ncbi:hypothetical protein G7Y89_g7776 [Cudoniella acicularis]|uniref:Aminoglycoside phosphotransferase domain-containing protein n=1 Tax=Cudoniella acicularis TaxID=354080 RepID=A0A8H4W3H0_9HELO|nr:hypothetical protein G7Y89_g7776 [Cudoniella acicularis]
MNPYEADQDKIPEADRYGDVPLYGRYLPREDDFKPEKDHIKSSTPESLRYWESVLEKCTPENRIYEAQEGGRDVFALGSVIVKSSHLKEGLGGRRSFRDYSFADRNELQTVDLVRGILRGVLVPEIYFASKINERNVLVQSRIPGVGLNIAWQYLTPAKKASFKSQARRLVTLMHKLRSPFPAPSYVVPDMDPVTHRGIQNLEHQILFTLSERDDLGFVHNDMSLSNIIVDNDRIVGIIDWEMAGYFGIKTAANVHVQIRMPKRSNFAALDLPEKMMKDILYWNDLYETSPTD